MKDPRKANNWDALNTHDRALWLHAYNAYLGKGKVK